MPNRFPYNLITEIDPDVDAEAVLDVASECHRYFSEMSRADWIACVDEVRARPQ